MKVFIIAGEPSGDALGAALMEGLRALRAGVVFEGVGGAAMAQAGLVSRFDMAELSVMGLAEVLPKVRGLLARVRETAAAIVAARPDVVITIDSPDFCLRVLKRARKALPDLRTVHYVAPSVWAWRPGRARKMAPLVDHVLALLPFEPPYMQAAGMSCDFVGHPVATAPQASGPEIAALRARVPGRIILALPGSRAGEIKRHAPIFGAALAAAKRDATVLVPTVAARAAQMRAAVADWPIAAEVVETEADKRAAFALAESALAASGTVSLELAASGTPMVIAYDVNPLSRLLARWLIKIDTVTLVNLVSETRAVPEYLGTECRADLIASALRKLDTDPQARAAQLSAMALTMERLGAGGLPPGQRAAASVLAYLDRVQSSSAESRSQ